MTVKSATNFDLDAFKRAYEQWDIGALLRLYADDVELVQVDRDNPPSSPRVRHGKDTLTGMFEHCAATVTCEFPSGRKVTANSILELEDGRIIRERAVQAGDPKCS